MTISQPSAKNCANVGLGVNALDKRVGPTTSARDFGRLVFAMLLIASLCACARKPNNRFNGDWAARPDVGSVSQRLILHLGSDSTGGLTASMDNLDAGIRNLHCDNVILKGDDLTLTAGSAHNYRPLQESSVPTARR